MPASAANRSSAASSRSVAVSASLVSPVMASDPVPIAVSVTLKPGERFGVKPVADHREWKNPGLLSGQRKMGRRNEPTVPDFSTPARCRFSAISEMNFEARRKSLPADARPRCTLCWVASRGSLIPGAAASGRGVGTLAVGGVGCFTYNWSYGSAIPTHNAVAVGDGQGRQLRRRGIVAGQRRWSA